MAEATDMTLESLISNEIGSCYVLTFELPAFDAIVEQVSTARLLCSLTPANFLKKFKVQPSKWYCSVNLGYPKGFEGL